VDVEKILGHGDEMHKFALGSGAMVRYRTDSASVPT
jgi:hypothetical protein